MLRPGYLTFTLGLPYMLLSIFLPPAFFFYKDILTFIRSLYFAFFLDGCLLRYLHFLHTALLYKAKGLLKVYLPDINTTQAAFPSESQISRFCYVVAPFLLESHRASKHETRDIAYPVTRGTCVTLQGSSRHNLVCTTRYFLHTTTPHNAYPTTTPPGCPTKGVGSSKRLVDSEASTHPAHPTHPALVGQGQQLQ
jgi:hypothetical protein